MQASADPFCTPRGIATIADHSLRCTTHGQQGAWRGNGHDYRPRTGAGGLEQHEIGVRIARTSPPTIFFERLLDVTSKWLVWSITKS